MIKFKHIAIQASNFEKSFKFYKKTLVLRVKKKKYKGDEKIAWFDLGNGTELEIFSPKPFTKKMKKMQSYSISGLCHFALKIENLDKFIKKLKNKKIKILRGPLEIDNRKIIFITGPDNEEIELID